MSQLETQPNQFDKMFSIKYYFVLQQQQNVQKVWASKQSTEMQKLRVPKLFNFHNLYYNYSYDICHQFHTGVTASIGLKNVSWSEQRTD